MSLCKTRTTFYSAIFYTAILFVSSTCDATTFDPVVWTRTIATSELEFASRVDTALNGDVVVAGTTQGNLGGAPPTLSGAFLRKYDASGATLWTNQFAGPSSEFISGLHIYDSGDIMTAGSVETTTISPPSVTKDIYLRRVGSNGAVQWTNKAEVAGYEHATNLAVAGSGDLFVSSYDNITPLAREIASLRKFDSNGALVWTRSHSTPTGLVLGLGVGADAVGNSYLLGQTTLAQPLEGSPNGGGAFISKYNSAGVIQWTRQYGNPDSSAWDMAVDNANNLYVTGYDGEFNSGFLKKLDDTGAVIWSILFGGGAPTSTLDLDASGNLFLGGRIGGSQAAYRRVTTDGVPIWTRQFPFSSSYEPDVAGDGLGNVYAYDTFNINNGLDAALVKALIIPEPSQAYSLCLLTLCSVHLISGVRKKADQVLAVRHL